MYIFHSKNIVMINIYIIITLSSQILVTNVKVLGGGEYDDE